MNSESDSKFLTRKWNIFNDSLNANYGAENEIIYNTEVLKSNICAYNEAYILVRSDIIIRAHSSSI